MEKEENCQANSLPTSFQMAIIGESSSNNTNNQMVDYMVNSQSIQQQHHNQCSLGFLPSNPSLDKLSFADVMQFADFGPKLALNQTKGDQASIIGGAIEFVRELEQLLQCLESQKRRRIYGDTPTRPLGDSSTPPPPLMPINQNPSTINPHHQSPILFPLPNEYNIEGEIQEEVAESKSCLADVEVKLLGFDAMIKILSRRRPGQLIKAIAALEDMQLSILHTNITTIEQTVLYSFNVKISGETRYTADDIANSIQQIFSFIHAEIAPYDIN
ncbi:hypothetical protein AABB24_030283 [Solanum stoloniferum]|uniref:Plant bHLH transcription factor ACT-like domain-containing protein n=1 Tax=Solanum stoloniferum TaxID=62892 RepID=A0ABD2S1E0_9SOLN